MSIGDLTTEEIAEYAIKKYTDAGCDRPTAINNAVIAAKLYIEDLKVSHEVCKGLHPHANGLTAGSIVTWKEVERILEEELKSLN